MQEKTDLQESRALAERPLTAAWSVFGLASLWVFSHASRYLDKMYTVFGSKIQSNTAMLSILSLAKGAVCTTRQ